MRDVIQAIKKYKRFIITAHVNLEGDSIGSQLAMYELLDDLGKEAFIVDNDAVPEHYKFLPKSELVLNKVDKKFAYDAAIVLDCPTLKRTGKVMDMISGGKVIINIDHHISNEKFGDINWVDPTASSTGEMVYRLFTEMGMQLSKDAALSIYVTILTDTGSFNYDNTSRVTHKIAGELLGYGLDPAFISEKVYERMSISDLKLLGLVLSTLTVNKKGDVAYLEITKKMLEDTGVDVTRSEGFINYARSLDKVKVAILFRDDVKEKGRINVSFRSKGDVDVNWLAAYFGGGGHIKASGCMLEGAMDDVKKKVLAKVEGMLSGRDPNR